MATRTAIRRGSHQLFQFEGICMPRRSEVLTRNRAVHGLADQIEKFDHAIKAKELARLLGISVPQMYKLGKTTIPSFLPRYRRAFRSALRGEVVTGGGINRAFLIVIMYCTCHSMSYSALLADASTHPDSSNESSPALPTRRG